MGRVVENVQIPRPLAVGVAKQPGCVDRRHGRTAAVHQYAERNGARFYARDRPTARQLARIVLDPVRGTPGSAQRLHDVERGTECRSAGKDVRVRIAESEDLHRCMQQVRSTHRSTGADRSLGPALADLGERFQPDLLRRNAAHRDDHLVVAPTRIADDGAHDGQPRPKRYDDSRLLRASCVRDDDQRKHTPDRRAHSAHHRPAKPSASRSSAAGSM